MKNQWINTGGEFRMREVSQQLEQLPVAIYKLQEDRFGFYMIEVDKKFNLPSKIYGIERPFIDRVKKSWANTTGNMGILLNGTRGTGKTVTAEIISNEMNLPVIIINDRFEGSITDFINELQDDCIILLDEYDKIFEKYSSTLLTVMDGVMKRAVRIMFILTTNDDHLNDNMYQRPSRIRYIKTFGNMDPDIVIEIIDDLLVHKELRDVVIKFISELTIITMDLVKSVIEEVNIHQEDPYEFLDIFNISDTQRTYQVFKIDENGKEEKILSRATLDEHILPFNQFDIGNGLYMNGNYYGRILEFNDASTIQVDWDDRSRKVRSNGEQEEEREIVTLTFRSISRKHYSFIRKGL